MYKTVFTPTESNSMILFRIPCDWYGIDVEVFAFPPEIPQTFITKIRKKDENILKKLPPKYIFTSKNFKINRDEANDYE